MTDGNDKALVIISKEELLDEYYENLHRAYNAMRDGFVVCGRTQDEIAYALGVDKSLISRRLNGSENLTLKTLSYMGSAMGARVTVKFVSYSQMCPEIYSFGLPPEPTKKLAPVPPQKTERIVSDLDPTVIKLWNDKNSSAPVPVS